MFQYNTVHDHINTCQYYHDGYPVDRENRRPPASYRQMKCPAEKSNSRTLIRAAKRMNQGRAIIYIYIIHHVGIHYRVAFQRNGEYLQ